MAQGVPAWDAQPGRRTAAGADDAPEETASKRSALDLAQPPETKTESVVDQIETMRDILNKNARNRLQIDRAEDSGRFIYRILNPETGETMRQWPPERYLELVAYLEDKRGGLVDESA
ncbi:MAG: flagellar protein FlaG [Alphaproteobacteria bacterium]|nr:flagellar protein FlaG [Alphaproteobacteria bacterium]